MVSIRFWIALPPGFVGRSALFLHHGPPNPVRHKGEKKRKEKRKGNELLYEKERRKLRTVRTA
jgi:hypothetical protein